MRINDPNLLRQVVNYLDKHQETVRIKKLLYCLCTGRWEKDTDYLNSINFQYLIEQIVGENNSLDLFRVLLQNLIKTVNKPKQYIEIAKVIYLAIGQLYPEFRKEHIARPQSPPPAPIPDPEPTSSAFDRVVPSALQRAYAPEPTQLTSQGIPSALVRAYAPLPTQSFSPSAPERLSPVAIKQPKPAPSNADVDESAYETYYDPDLSASGGHFNNAEVSAEDRPEVPEYDPFVLRQSVMSYANPLRAKMILLVMLQPDLNFGTQSLATMREYQLDDLLLDVLKAYTTVPQLEESMTYAVELLVELEEYGKAATGLLQSLIPLYKNRG